MAKKNEKMIKITQLRSIIGRTERQKKTMHALGLRKIRHYVVHKDTPQLQGMINKVQHLVSVEIA